MSTTDSGWVELKMDDDDLDTADDLVFTPTDQFANDLEKNHGKAMLELYNDMRSRVTK